MERLLIVNADDYALTEGVSRAILRAHRDGVVRSTTVLANGAAFDRTGPWLRDVPALGVGVHLTLVGGDPPVLSAREVPTLVDRAGRLRESWQSFFIAQALRRIDPTEVERELAAQLARVRSLGVVVTHLDTHQHTHLWPSIGGAVVELARREGVAAIRVPRSGGQRRMSLAVRLLARRLSRRAAAAGLRQTAGFAGFDEAGQLGRERLIATLRRLATLPHATFELGVHPGEDADPALARYPWQYRWGEELTALTDPQVRSLIASLGFRLGSFAELTRAASA